MKTEVIMKRKLFGYQISQRSKTEFFSATDLARAGNAWRMSRSMDPFSLKSWFKSKQNIDFVNAVKRKYGQVKISGRGSKSHTWVHPLLFIDIALAIDPELKIEVYEWLYDYLLKYRNDSEDSYKRMSGSLWVNHGNKATFHKYIKNVALEIREVIDVPSWQDATQVQLYARDKIHDNIAVLANVLSSNSQAVRIGILEEKKILGDNK